MTIYEDGTMDYEADIENAGELFSLGATRKYHLHSGFLGEGATVGAVADETDNVCGGSFTKGHFIGCPSKPLKPQRAIEEILWRAITRIPVYKPKGEDWYLPDARKDTRARNKSMSLYQKLQVAAEDPNVLEHYNIAQEHVQAAEQELHNLWTAHDAASHPPGTIPD